MNNTLNSNALILNLHQALQALENDAIIAYLTDTIWGLGGLPSPNVAKKIITCKKRPAEKGFILLTHKLALLEPWISLSLSEQNAIMQTETPTTWIAPIKENIQAQHITGNHNSIAFRLTRITPWLEPIFEYFQSPLITTSANLSHQLFINHPDKIIQAFQSCIRGVYMDHTHRTPNHQPSQIIDLKSGQIIRAI